MWKLYCPSGATEPTGRSGRFQYSTVCIDMHHWEKNTPVWVDHDCDYDILSSTPRDLRHLWPDNILSITVFVQLMAQLKTGCCKKEQSSKHSVHGRRQRTSVNCDPEIFHHPQTILIHIHFHMKMIKVLQVYAIVDQFHVWNGFCIFGNHFLSVCGPFDICNFPPICLQNCIQLIQQQICRSVHLQIWGGVTTQLHKQVETFLQMNWWKYSL